MVVDTSAILAVFFAESAAQWVADQLHERRAELRMSTVNLSETLILLRDRLPSRFLELERRLLDSGMVFVPPDQAQARIAAEARSRFPLNLGDCFAYALAKVEDCPVLTLDRDFRDLDHPVILPP